MSDHPDESLSQSIYLLLRRRIIAGELQPETRLRERELAEDLSVSRVPVREAILRLEGDGLVTSAPRRGAMVARLTLIDVAELFDARLALEVQTTRLAARRAAGGADAGRLRHAIERAETVLESGDPDLVNECNAAVHDEIVALADNSLVAALMRPITGRDRWIFRLLRNRDPHDTCREHQELYSAIAAGEVDLAAALAHAHVERGRHQALNGLRGILPDE